MTITLGPKCVGPQGRTNVGLEALNFSSNVWLILKCVSQDISCIQRPQERIQATTHKKEPQRAQWGVHRLLSKDNRWADRSVGTACPSARLSCKCLLTAHCCILCGYTEILNFSLRLFGKFPFPLSNAPFPASLYWVLTSRMNSTPFSSVQLLSHVRLHEPQHARPPCPSPSPRVHPNPCPLSWWCHLAISSSVVPFSFCPQSFPASESFPMSQLFVSGGHSIGVSASTSVLPMNTKDSSPLGWTGWISLQSKELSRVFSNTTVRKHQFFCAKLSLLSNSQIHT